MSVVSEYRNFTFISCEYGTIDSNQDRFVSSVATPADGSSRTDRDSLEHGFQICDVIQKP